MLSGAASHENGSDEMGSEFEDEEEDLFEDFDENRDEDPDGGYLGEEDVFNEAEGGNPDEDGMMGLAEDVAGPSSHTPPCSRRRRVVRTLRRRIFRGPLSFDTSDEEEEEEDDDDDELSDTQDLSFNGLMTTRSPTDQRANVTRPSLELPSSTRLKVTVNAFHAVAGWRWRAAAGDDDACGICRMPFDACCVECQFPGDDCPLVVGVCRHPFHAHCIRKWTESHTAPRPQCPLCRQEWRVP